MSLEGRSQGRGGGLARGEVGRLLPGHESRLRGGRGLVERLEELIELSTRFAIVAARSVEEGGAVDRVVVVEGGLEQGFEAPRIKRHREGLPLRGKIDGSTRPG